MYNRTLASSRRIRRWLRWLGAEELSPTPHDGVVWFGIVKKKGEAHV